MLLFFDTETTGLPRNWSAPVEDLDNWPRLVQIAWLVYDRDEKKIGEGQYIIKPEGFSIPAQSASVHGITTERALAEGNDLGKVLAEFSEAVDDADFLIAHNMNFDEKIMGSEFLRGGVENKLFQRERICTMLSSVDFCQIPSANGDGYKWPRLSELHIALFGKDFDDAHDAFVDTSACARCFFELCRKKVIDIPALRHAEAKVMRQGSLFLLFLFFGVR